MKKPIVGEEGERYTVWTLPNKITLAGHNPIAPDNPLLDIDFGDEHVGTIYKNSAQELFQVILYPPGSEPSPESADPTDKYRMREEKERQYEIPRIDILDNGDWN